MISAFVLRSLALTSSQAITISIHVIAHSFYDISIFPQYRQVKILDKGARKLSSKFFKLGDEKMQPLSSWLCYAPKRESLGTCETLPNELSDCTAQLWEWRRVAGAFASTFFGRANGPR